MAPFRNFSEHERNEIQRLLAANFSCNAIAKAIGCRNTTLHSYIKRQGLAYPYGEHLRQSATPAEAPELNEEACLEWCREGDEITCGRIDRPYSEPEVLQLAQVDTTIWETEKFKTWSSFYRSKDRLTHTKVWHSSLTLRRKLPPGFQEGIESFLDRHQGDLSFKHAPLVPSRRGTPQCVVTGFWDVHFGMFSWHGETTFDYDMKIATRRLLNATDDLVAELAPYNLRCIYLVVGNDFFHFDNTKGVTEHAGNLLDTDTRWAKVYDAGIEVQTHILKRFRQICDDVRIVLISGNHDEVSAWWLGQVLAREFKDVPGFTWDLRAVKRKYYLWEQTLLGFAHGNFVRPVKLVGNLMSEARELISGSKYCEIHVGDKHHPEDFSLSRITHNEHAITLRVNPSLVVPDAYHYSHGFTGASQMAMAWRYYPHGLAGHHIAWSRDD